MKPLAINAWTGTASPQARANPRRWAAQKIRAVVKLAAPERADPRDWTDARVGWGLVLPENTALSESERSTAVDAPAPLRRLLDTRLGSPVLRYSMTSWAHMKLLRYYMDGTSHQLDIFSSDRGSDAGCLPMYLLIAAAPDVIPWDVQYILDTCAFTGRLSLPEAALSNYVDHLIRDWNDEPVTRRKPLIWSVDHGGGDITTLMRQAIAEPMAKRLSQDTDVTDVLHLSTANATADALIDALAERNPAMVVTTSHGMTGPQSNLQVMRQNLGMPVDQNHAMLSHAALLDKWSPNGAIWYAHACCSAGSDAVTRFKGLVPDDSDVAQLLADIAALGALIAPLPVQLLSALHPVRAFIGHVEPTFNWTLEDPVKEQILTAPLLDALYDRMHQARGEPVGLALRDFHRDGAGIIAASIADAGRVSTGLTSEARDVYAALATQKRLTGYDHQTLVVLGDPTVALPSLT